MANIIIFYVLAILTIYGAISTVLRKNPVACALHLALSMICLSGLFFILGAHFIAGVQLVVYAGAVMVLFVIVIMLFDNESVPDKTKAQSQMVGLKSLLSIAIFGLLAGMVPHSVGSINKLSNPHVVDTKQLSYSLFTKYILIFEWLGLLLLIIAVGVVTLNQIEKVNQSSNED